MHRLKEKKNKFIIPWLFQESRNHFLFIPVLNVFDKCCLGKLNIIKRREINHLFVFLTCHSCSKRKEKKKLHFWNLNTSFPLLLVTFTKNNKHLFISEINCQCEAATFWDCQFYHLLLPLFHWPYDLKSDVAGV